MAKFVIEGGYRLSGEITPAGAKTKRPGKWIGPAIRTT